MPVPQVTGHYKIMKNKTENKVNLSMVDYLLILPATKVQQSILDMHLNYMFHIQSVFVVNSNNIYHHKQFLSNY